MNKKISQYIMIWFLPLVVIGGLFVPALGYIMVGMMIFFLILAYFRGRFWCTNLCPRGSFLDLILKRFSLRNKMPAFLLSVNARWIIFAIVMTLFILQLVFVHKDVYSVGFVFVRLCLITTIIAIVMGISWVERAWCVICPMGTLQSKIGSLKKERG